MSHHKTAAGLASLGRGEDSMLVHMTPREVAGLQKIAVDHGGSLTINPHTGLPEAGFLKSILPALAGIGLSFIPGIGPLAAAALSGGVTGLMTKDWKQGLLAALSAGAASGATQGLAGLGKAATAPGVTTNLAGNTLREMGTKTLADAGTKGFMSNLGAGASRLLSGQAGASGMAALGGKLGLGALAAPMLYEAAKPAKYKAPDVAKGEKFRYYKTRYHPGVYNPNAGFGESMFTGQGYDEGQYYDKYPENYDSSVFTAAEGGAVPAAPQQDLQAYFQNMLAPPAQTAAPDTSAITNYVNQLNQSLQPKAPVAPVAPTAPVTPAKPTIPGLPAGFDPSKLGSFMGINFAGLGNLANSGNRYTYDPATQQFTSAQPYGKKRKKGYAAGGRLLSGGGDGMSDSIPAMIDGPKPQQARLADGEFVVPADVVSHLGNGSTKAGANQLYSMMDKVRQARTGQTKQAPAISPNKFLA